MSRQHRLKLSEEHRGHRGIVGAHTRHFALGVAVLVAWALVGCASPAPSRIARGNSTLAPNTGPNRAKSRRPLADWRATRTIIEAASQQSPYVALTFDAGSDASAVPLLLKTLNAWHVRSTFFLTGKFCERFPTACRAIVAAGMELGNHSYSHPHFTHLMAAQIHRQLQRSEETIKRVCGKSAKPLFRFPYGDANRDVCSLVAQDGYQPIGWSIDSLDAVGKRKPPEFVARRIVRLLRPGVITLMHVSCVDSARALPVILARLEAMHLKPVPVSELLIDAAAARVARTSHGSHRKSLHSRTLS